MMTITDVASRLIELCTAHNFTQAQKELYANDITSIETDGSQRAGLDTLLVKEQNFLDSLEQLFLVEFSAPLVAGSFFTTKLTMEFDMKNVGRRKVEELCVYRVLNGKVVSEQFFRD
jgi:2-oxo-4-hydroxy-4-carboxy--5-ureidoimidazoline (OHCU) decarboxylase